MEQDKPENQTGLISHLFREEYARMMAVLCRHFGLKHIETAEDIASDTFLKASEHWAVHGIPENPTAWLYAVAKNKVKDTLRHLSVSERKLKHIGVTGLSTPENDFEVSEQLIEDSQLAMIFAVCNPVNSPESQVCLALQILCGFSVEEIANAFLTNRETIKKRLQRARHHLRTDAFSLRELNANEIRSRLDTVLKTIYLLFNEGYFSQSHRSAVRKDLCSEAIRLAVYLTEKPLTCAPQVNALLALMCFQSSRLEARINATGEAVLFNEQNKTLWNQQLIQRGNHYLVAATNSNEISNYHLEAAIAYWHTTEAGDKWKQILKLYDQLILMVSSPLIALSRAFAFANVYGSEKAIPEVEKLRLTDNQHYYALLGYLYTGLDQRKAVENYQTALSLTKSAVEKQSLQKEISRLNDLKYGRDGAPGSLVFGSYP